MRWFVVLVLLVPLAASADGRFWPDSDAHWTLAPENRPGQFGFGGRATGGLGYPSLTIDTLSDFADDGSCTDGDCSIRDALGRCNAAGGGRIDFAGLSGSLNLGGGGPFTWSCPNSTIDGSTAASGGVQLLGVPASPGTSVEFILDVTRNVIIRHMKFRCSGFTSVPAAPGCLSAGRNVFRINGGRDIFLDHVSIEWATGGLGDVGDANLVTDVTYQNSLLAESLANVGLTVGAGVTRVSFVRNAFLSNGSQNPLLSPGSVLSGITDQNVELIENYTYNFVQAVGHQAGGGTLRINSASRGNVWETGPTGLDVDETLPIRLATANTGRVWAYFANNLLKDGVWDWEVYAPPPLTNTDCDPGAVEATQRDFCTWPTTANSACDETSEAPCATIATRPVQGVTPSYLSTQHTKSFALVSAGATLPCRDSLDGKVVSDANLLVGASPLPLTAVSTVLPTLSGAACNIVAPATTICSDRLDTAGPKSEVSTYDTAGVEILELTGDGLLFSNIQPSWTPAGQVLWSSDREDGGQQDIWRMNSDGTAKTLITDDASCFDFTPDMNPAGTKIAFSRLCPGGVPQVWVMNADGTGQTQLTTTASVPASPVQGSLHPSWSADGTKLVFSSLENGVDVQIWKMNSADGTAKEQMTFGFGPDYPQANVPNVSPDGTKIAFWSGKEVQFGEAWVMDFAGTNPRRITETTDPGNSDDPRWANGSNTVLIYGRNVGLGREMWLSDINTLRADQYTTGVHWCD